MAEELYICSKCGKESKQKTKFCPECGGSVSSYNADEIKFVCEKCGKEFAEKWNYCHDCAGRIVTSVPYTYSCSKCGMALNENTKFCSECGGKAVRHGGVIGKEVAQETASAETEGKHHSESRGYVENADEVRKRSADEADGSPQRSGQRRPGGGHAR